MPPGIQALQSVLPRCWEVGHLEVMGEGAQVMREGTQVMREGAQVGHLEVMREGTQVGHLEVMRLM